MPNDFPLFAPEAQNRGLLFWNYSRFRGRMETVSGIQVANEIRVGGFGPYDLFDYLIFSSVHLWHVASS
jgi:hypothetical protein